MPSSAERVLLRSSERTENVISSSLGHKIDNASAAVAKISGTEDGNEDPKRFGLFIAGFITASIVASQIPNHEFSSYTSILIGALGGAFAGDNLRVVSRFGKFNSDKFVNKLKKGDGYSEEELLDFLSHLSGCNFKIENKKQSASPLKTT